MSPSSLFQTPLRESLGDNICGRPAVGPPPHLAALATCPKVKGCPWVLLKVPNHSLGPDFGPLGRLGHMLGEESHKSGGPWALYFRIATLWRELRDLSGPSSLPSRALSLPSLVIRVGTVLYFCTPHSVHRFPLFKYYTPRTPSDRRPLEVIDILQLGSSNVPHGPAHRTS